MSYLIVDTDCLNSSNLSFESNDRALYVHMYIGWSGGFWSVTPAVTGRSGGHREVASSCHFLDDSCCDGDLISVFMALFFTKYRSILFFLFGFLEVFFCSLSTIVTASGD